METRVGAAPLVAVDEADPWFGHFLRYLALAAVVGVSLAFVVGYVWLAFLLSRTGRRKRDVLLCVIPIIGSVLLAQTIWRAIARTTYWSVRADRPSSPIQGGARPALLIVGALLWPIVLAAMVFSVLAAPTGGWSERDRADLVGQLVNYSENPLVNLCMAEYIEGEYPDGPESLPTDTAAVQDLLLTAEASC